MLVLAMYCKSPETVDANLKYAKHSNISHCDIITLR